MKGKIMFVLFSLVLIFGVVVASCDNGLLPAKPEVEMDLQDWPKETIDVPAAWGDVLSSAAYTKVYVDADGDGKADLDKDGNPEGEMTVNQALNLIRDNPGYSGAVCPVKNVLIVSFS